MTSIFLQTKCLKITTDNQTKAKNYSEMHILINWFFETYLCIRIEELDAKGWYNLWPPGVHKLFYIRI